MVICDACALILLFVAERDWSRSHSPVLVLLLALVVNTPASVLEAEM